jgi:hypothetical protein
VKRKDQKLFDDLRVKLDKFAIDVKPLMGIVSAARRESLIRQFIESVHRLQFPAVIRSRNISAKRGDPSDTMFDPLKAAILQERAGNLDEAFWLVFLFVHFGRHPTGGWRYAREVYGRLNTLPHWTWANTSVNPAAFRKWLDDHQAQLKRPGGGFGNHRKYESLDAYKVSGTGNTVETYVAWIGPPRTHEKLFLDQCAQAGGDARKAFSILYKSMSQVARFGRTARFDYLAMIGKLGMANIEPGATYVTGSTGQSAGAKLLFFDNTAHTVRSKTLDSWLIELDGSLGLGMQAIEDALCNWQKSPNVFKPFRA